MSRIEEYRIASKVEEFMTTFGEYSTYMIKLEVEIGLHVENQGSAVLGCVMVKSVIPCSW